MPRRNLLRRHTYYASHPESGDETKDLKVTGGDGHNNINMIANNETRGTLSRRKGPSIVYVRNIVLSSV